MQDTPFTLKYVTKICKVVKVMRITKLGKLPNDFTMTCAFETLQKNVVDKAKVD